MCLLALPSEEIIFLVYFIGIGMLSLPSWASRIEIGVRECSDYQ